MWIDLLMSLYLAATITIVFAIIGYYTYRILNRSRKGKSMPSLDNTFIFIPNSLQEDPKSHESIKRTRKAFMEQEEQMKARALKPHSYDCPDPFTCTKNPCFIYEPDKIIRKIQVRRKTNEKRAFDERAYQVNGRRDEDDLQLFDKFKEISKQ